MDNFCRVADIHRSFSMDAPEDDVETRLLLGVVQVVLAITALPLIALILFLVLAYVIAESIVLHLQAAFHHVARWAVLPPWGGLSFYQRRPVKG